MTEQLKKAAKKLKELHELQGGESCLMINRRRCTNIFKCVIFRCGREEKTEEKEKRMEMRNM